MVEALRQARPRTESAHKQPIRRMSGAIHAIPRITRRSKQITIEIAESIRYLVRHLSVLRKQENRPQNQEVDSR